MKAISGLCIGSLAAASMICLLFAGCGGNTAESELAKYNSNHIQRLTNLYYTYQKDNNWQGPEDEETLKEFIRGYSPRKLERAGVDAAKVDELFISERDGEPFKVRYGVEGSMMGCSKPVVFEATGVNGKKMVGLLSMSQREVEQAEYDDLWAGKGDDGDASTRDESQ